MTQWRGARAPESPADQPEASTTESPRTVAFTWPQASARPRATRPGTQQLDLSDPQAVRAGLGFPRARDTETGVAHEAPPPAGLPFRQTEAPHPGGYGYSSVPPPSAEPPVSSGTFPAPSAYPSAPPPASHDKRPSRAWNTAWGMSGGQTIGQYLQSQQQTAAQSAPAPAPAALHAILPPPLEAPQPAQQGAVAASDAAADRGAFRHASQVVQVAPAPAAEIPDLLWFDAASTARVRVWHRELLSTQRAVAFDERLALSAESPQDFKVRTDILAVLTQSQIERGDVSHLVQEGLSPTGHYVAPLVTLDGWLTFTFSEAEELRALIGQAELHRAQHPDLAHSIDEAQKLLDCPATAAAHRTLARATRFIRAKVRSALGTEGGRRIDRDVEAILLDDRSYKKRTFLGAEWLRTVISHPSGETVAYLPSSLAEQLPLFATMRTRVIAEVIPAQDHFEASSFALRTVALARLLQPTVFAA